MSIKEIIVKNFKKIKILKKHNDLYFNYDKPRISDSEYDKLKNEILELEKKHPYLKDLESASSIVGASPTNKFEKIKHLKPMLSLSNAFDLDDMINFTKKVNNFLNIKEQNLELFAEPKIDGISASLIYKKGILVQGLSRRWKNW